MPSPAVVPETVALVRDSVIDHAWACVPKTVPAEQRAAMKARAAELLKQLGAVLVSHYYVDADLQDLALETGGCVSDSLEMARFGREHPAKTLVVSGVRFMGETSKILSPEKRVLMPAIAAECSLDLGCPADEFTQFCDAHPDRTVVVYANTSAAVKARADWCVTSSIGLDIVRHLHAQGQKILFAPDKHLGRYIQEQTGADMLMWPGVCIVHDEFKGLELELLKAEHPQAKVLVHPESPRSVVQLADVVGSTSQMLNAARTLPAKEFIVATDKGLMHSMRKAVPEKIFIEAPTAGTSATCKSCAHCPWMAMNDLTGLVHLLEDAIAGRDVREHGGGEIVVDPALGRQAYKSIDRMLAFAAERKAATSKAPASFASAGSQNIGPA